MPSATSSIGTNASAVSFLSNVCNSPLFSVRAGKTKFLDLSADGLLKVVKAASYLHVRAEDDPDSIRNSDLEVQQNARGVRTISVACALVDYRL